MKQSVTRVALAVVLLAACSSCPSEAQENAASPKTPTIRVQSSLVLVDVISQDPRSGLPVRDFKKEDFQLFDNREEVPIATFDAGARYDTRPVIVWLVVICDEQGKVGGSSQFVGKEALFRPALDHLDKLDTVGVAHWCDNGETRLDLLPTDDRDKPIEVLTETIQPIPYRIGGNSNLVGEVTFRKMVRLIIRDAHRRNPQPLPVVVFLDADYTGQPRSELNALVDDFLETSGIVFGIKDANFPALPQLQHEQGEIMHYMADQTGGQFLAAAPAGYSAALDAIMMQLHFRYELGFVPPAIDGKRHELKVELTKGAKETHKGVRLRFQPEYIPVREEPAWAH
jgi:hypothetical protein